LEREIISLRSARLVACLLVSLIGVTLAACGGSPRTLPVDRVVFITIDTLRADHLPSFGYPIDTAPFIEDLASRGTSFKRAYAQSATTGPSHASMFTSLYPMQHGAHGNGQMLDESYLTLAEMRNDNGKLMLYRSCKDTTAVALDWLEGMSADDRFFAWVHYYDPHKPFRAPRRLVKRATPQQVVEALTSGIEAPIVDEETLKRLRALGYIQ